VKTPTMAKKRQQWQTAINFVVGGKHQQWRMAKEQKKTAENNTRQFSFISSYY